MSENTSRFQNIASWAAVLLWMLLIFYLSSQVAEQSNELSTGITKVVVQTVEKVNPNSGLDIHDINRLLRKNAHFFMYFVLGVLVSHALGKRGVSGWRRCLMAVTICVFCAISDEMFQLFVPGRGGQLKDVGIDSAGALLGIGLYHIIHHQFERRKRT